MKWSDILRIKAEFPVKVWPNAAQAYYRYVWESLARNKPYDQFARELLTSSGSNYRVGAGQLLPCHPEQDAGRHRRGRGPGVDERTRTHTWPEDRRAGMAVFFTQVGYKPTSEWKEESHLLGSSQLGRRGGLHRTGASTRWPSRVTVTNQIPQALAEPLEPERAAGGRCSPTAPRRRFRPNRDPREVFADWLIRPGESVVCQGHRQSHLGMDRWGDGIIHEPDDIRDDNPPCNPELC